MTKEKSIGDSNNNNFLKWLLFIYFIILFVIASAVVFIDIVTNSYSLTYIDYLTLLGFTGFCSWVFY